MVRETTLTILNAIETVSRVKSEKVRVISLSTKEITEITRLKDIRMFRVPNTLKALFTRGLTQLVSTKLLADHFGFLL